ncbi:hypothetical protein M752DRAFT_268216 [Aspergillus phoenicis ATCC 13157]|uniref:Uncharacterized protein n=1 Tax=Aspergillus phoenicis ATCC 13157 TaxID=1353007 RepID=A0A370PE06_ASPPH|nr:hypothetical protein M752DRAFT_268216 [Aspergillus phoenicis ATCC 13157]
MPKYSLLQDKSCCKQPQRSSYYLYYTNESPLANSSDVNNLLKGKRVAKNPNYTAAFYLTFPTLFSLSRNTSISPATHSPKPQLNSNPTQRPTIPNQSVSHHRNPTLANTPDIPQPQDPRMSQKKLG